MVGVGTCVDAADTKRLVVLHAVPVVLSIRAGGPVGKGGQNSDEALVASRFLSGHAPPDPTAQMERSEAASPEPTCPTHDAPPGVGLCPGQAPTRPPDLIFTLCATALRAQQESEPARCSWPGAARTMPKRHRRLVVSAEPWGFWPAPSDAGECP
jgi:hypothetical protein